MGRVFVAFGFIVCLQAISLACSSRITSAGLPVPSQPDRAPEPPSPVPSTPKPSPSAPAATPLGPEAGSTDCALIAEPGEPVATVALRNPIDPSNALHPSNDSERLVFRQLYETLVRTDCHGRVSPGLAASWQLDANGRTWIVTLREDARFSDGAPVTAADVQASWTDGTGGELRPPVSGLVQSVTVVGERALAIVLRSQRVDVPMALAHPDLAIAKSVADSPWRLGTRSSRITTEGHLGAARAATVITVDRDNLPAIRFFVTADDTRDLLDQGVDLLVTRDPATLEYAATLPQFRSVPLAWQRTRVLLAPGRSRSAALLSEDARHVLADDAVRGEARGARGPFWWQEMTDCEVTLSPPPILQVDPDWSAVPGSVPAEVCELLRNCLTKDARRRVGNFADIRRELARAISELAVPEGERPRKVVFLGALPVVLIAALAFVRPSWLAHFDDTAYDMMLRWSVSHPPDPRVVIIDIDDRSLGTIGRWPRDLLGRLVDRLRELGADTIAFNMMLVEPETSRGFAGAGVDALRQTPDELLAESLRGSKVVVGYGFTFQQPVTSAGSCELHPLDLSQLSSGGTVRSDQTPFFKASGVVCTFRLLAVAAGRSGFLNGAPDPDGVFRRVPLVIEFNGRVYPSLAVATVAAATSTRSAVLNIANRSYVSLALGERVVPLDGKGNLLVRFRGQKRTLSYVSAADIMDGRALPNSIRNKIAFVGYTAFGIRSAVRTPLDANFFDLEVQATVADNLLQGDFIHRAIRYEILECVAVLILGITLTLIVARVGLIAGSVAALLELAIVWAGATWLFSVTGTFLSPFYPTVGLGLVFVTLTLARARRESRRIGLAMRRIEDVILNR